MRRALLSTLFFLFLFTPARADFWGDTYHKVLQSSVVLVLTHDSQCTGEMVASGLFLTAAHCVADNGYLVDHLDHKYEFEVVKRSEGFDLALMTAKVPTKQPMRLSLHFPYKGQPVYAIGYSEVFDQYAPSYKGGEISNFVVGFIIVNAPLRAGYSGGPLVNSYGELVGVDVRSDKESWGAAVPIETVRFFLQR